MVVKVLCKTLYYGSLKGVKKADFYSLKTLNFAIFVGLSFRRILQPGYPVFLRFSKVF